MARFLDPEPDEFSDQVNARLRPKCDSNPPFSSMMTVEASSVNENRPVGTETIRCSQPQHAFPEEFSILQSASAMNAKTTAV
ncbi:hypothetical protein N7513_008916 [Penicillium frequentans]|nr:hypothetical protein N7513_008916 [Penicillium glabrum]